MYVSIYLSVYLHVYLPVCLSFYLDIYLGAYLSTYLSIFFFRCSFCSIVVGVFSRFLVFSFVFPSFLALSRISLPYLVFSRDFLSFLALSRISSCYLVFPRGFSSSLALSRLFFRDFSSSSLGPRCRGKRQKAMAKNKREGEEEKKEK